jgi:hypothetical protein
VEFADTHLGVDPHTQYQKESEKGVAGGYASLDGSGKIPSAQIPDIAITEFLGVAANQAAMLGAVGQKGDWVIRSDENKVYVITGSDPSVIGGWTALAYPADAVVSVNGETGAVSLSAADVGAEPAGAVATHESTYDHTDIPDPTAAAENYVWTADGLGSAGWQPGGGGSPTDSYWKFSTSVTDADPSNGKFKLNDALRANATFLYIDNQTLAGLNISNFTPLLAVGDQVFIQPKSDASSRVRYNVTGPAVDGTGYWKIPVSVSVAPVGPEISNNAEVLLLWNIAALGGTPSTHNHDDRYYTESEIDTLLSGKETAGAAASAVSAHEGAADPHVGYQKESEKGVADGYASLDSGGQVPAAQIPAIAITEYLGAAANQAAMLALVGQKGDWCTRTDLGTNWVITGDDPTQLASWTALTYPASPVVSVNGETGAVSLDATDVGAAATSHGSHSTTTYATTPPGSPNIGDRWISNETGNEYIWLNDGTSTQWVMTDAGGSGGGGGSLTIQDESGNIATGVTQIDFQGAGVAATAGTGEVIVTVSGGGSFYQTVKPGNEVALTQRPTLNFSGVGVNLRDRAGTTETRVVVGGAYADPQATGDNIGAGLEPTHVRAADLVIAAGEAFAIPFIVSQSIMSLDRIGFEVISGGGTAEVALYNANVTFPSNAQRHVTGISTASTGFKDGVFSSAYSFTAQAEFANSFFFLCILALGSSMTVRAGSLIQAQQNSPFYYYGDLVNPAPFKVTGQTSLAAISIGTWAGGTRPTVVPRLQARRSA